MLACLYLLYVLLTAMRKFATHRPFAFLNRLHVKFPQFAEKGQQGGLMQHDAEECWNAVLMSFARTVPRSDATPGQAVHQEHSIVSELFQGTTEARVSGSGSAREMFAYRTYSSIVCVRLCSL